MDERILFVLILTLVWTLLFGISYLFQRRRHGTIKHWAPSTLVVLLGHAASCTILVVIMLVHGGPSLDNIGQANNTFINFIIANTLCCMFVDLVAATVLRTQHTDTYPHHILSVFLFVVILVYDRGGWEMAVATGLVEATPFFYMRRLVAMQGKKGGRLDRTLARVQGVVFPLVRGILIPMGTYFVLTHPGPPLAEKLIVAAITVMGLYWAFNFIRHRMHEKLEGDEPEGEDSPPARARSGPG